MDGFSTVAKHGPYPLDGQKQLVISSTNLKYQSETAEAPHSTDVFGKTAPVYRLDSLNMTNEAKLNITAGDVTLIIDGDFSMSGLSQLTISDDASLTIFVGGKVSFGGPRLSINKDGVRNNGKIAMSLYSSYDRSDGILLSGSGSGQDKKIYAAVYAPLTDVKLTHSAELFGGLRGKTVSSNGDSRIHYDEALGLADVGDDHGKPPELVLGDWVWM